MTENLSKNEIFSSVDAAWFHMNTPTNLALITGFITFDTVLDFELLRATIENRLLIQKRFRQRVKEDNQFPLLPAWEFDPNFNIDNHLSRISLPEPCNDQELQKLISDQMSYPFELNKPLWQFQFVDNYYQGSALVCRIHHCVADGLGLVQVLLSICDEEAGSSWPAKLEIDAKETQLSPLAEFLRPVVKAAMVTQHTLRKAELMAQQSLATLTSPSRLIETTSEARNVVWALGKLVLLPPDKRTLFRGQCGTNKKVVWSADINLDEIKNIGYRMGGTVNDILLSALTGALRRYLEEHGENAVGLNIRAVIPVNLRSPDDVDLLGNRFGLVYLTLPVGVRDPIKRLVILKRRMNVIKNSPESIVAFGILEVTGLSPQIIQDIIGYIFGMKGSVVVTNVPGPPAPLYLAGGKIDTIMFWVPTPGYLSLGISIISYSGKVLLGVLADEAVIVDPQYILRNFHEEFEYLKAWGHPPTINPLND